MPPDTHIQPRGPDGSATSYSPAAAWRSGSPSPGRLRPYCSPRPTSSWASPPLGLRAGRPRDGRADALRRRGPALPPV